MFPKNLPTLGGLLQVVSYKAVCALILLFLVAAFVVDAAAISETSIPKMSTSIIRHSCVSVSRDSAPRLLGKQR